MSNQPLKQSELEEKVGVIKLSELWTNELAVFERQSIYYPTSLTGDIFKGDVEGEWSAALGYHPSIVQGVYPSVFFAQEVTFENFVGAQAYNHSARNLHYLGVWLQLVHQSVADTVELDKRLADANTTLNLFAKHPDFSDIAKLVSLNSRELLEVYASKNATTRQHIVNTDPLLLVRDQITVPIIPDILERAKAQNRIYHELQGRTDSDSN